MTTYETLIQITLVNVPAAQFRLRFAMSIAVSLYIHKIGKLVEK